MFLQWLKDITLVIMIIISLLPYPVQIDRKNGFLTRSPSFGAIGNMCYYTCEVLLHLRWYLLCVLSRTLKDGF